MVVRKNSKRRIEYAIIRDRLGLIALPYDKALKTGKNIIFSSFGNNGKQIIKMFLGGVG